MARSLTGPPLTRPSPRRAIRYEAHLSRQLQLTLNQLERIQKARAGEPIPPPLALDVNISNGPPPG